MLLKCSVTRSANLDTLHVFGTLITSANPFVAVLIFDWIINIGIWEYNTHICIKIMYNKSRKLMLIFLFKFRTIRFLYNFNISYVSPFIKPGILVLKDTYDKGFRVFYNCSLLYNILHTQLFQNGSINNITINKLLDNM